MYMLFNYEEIDSILWRKLRILIIRVGTCLSIVLLMCFHLYCPLPRVHCTYSFCVIYIYFIETVIR